MPARTIRWGNLVIIRRVVTISTRVMINQITALHCISLAMTDVVNDQIATLLAVVRTDGLGENQLTPAIYCDGVHSNNSWKHLLK